MIYNKGAVKKNFSYRNGIGGCVMNDWNGNGKYDMSDSFMDYHMANSGSSGASSDWWKWVLLAIIVGVCPPIGIIIFFGILIFG